MFEMDMQVFNTFSKDQIVPKDKKMKKKNKTCPILFLTLQKELDQ